MVELEHLKAQLKLQHGADSSSWMEQPKSHTPDTVQISTSNLPQLDWDSLAEHPSPNGSAISHSPATAYDQASQAMDVFGSLGPGTVTRQTSANSSGVILT